MRYFRHANRDYIAWAVDKGFRLTTTPVIFQLYSEPMQKMRLAAQGHGAVQPPEQHRQRIETYFDPLPFWYPPFEGAPTDAQLPAARHYAAADGDVPPLGLAECVAAADPRRQPAVHEPRARGRARHRRRRLGVDHLGASGG